jgi:cyclopropane-fatty-acyl-phospholipid synthase
MVEAVGQRWWGAYLDSIARNLKTGGHAALQFISIRDELFDRYARNADFIQTYIFPGGCLLDAFHGTIGRASVSTMLRP